MKIASVADIKAHFSAYLRAATRGPVVVTRSGKPAGILLAIDDEEELERLVLAYSPRLRTILDAARRNSTRRPVATVGNPPRNQTVGQFAPENGINGAAGDSRGRPYL